MWPVHSNAPYAGVGTIDCRVQFIAPSPCVETMDHWLSSLIYTTITTLASMRFSFHNGLYDGALKCTLHGGGGTMDL